MKTSIITTIVILVIVAIVVGFGIRFLLEKMPKNDREVMTTPPPVDNGERPTPPPPVTPPPVTHPPTTPPTSPPLSGGTANFVYTFNQLKSGNIGNSIIHCSGPLFTPSKHVAYNNEFSQTKSYMVRTDTNFADVARFTPAEKIATMKNSFNQFPNEIPIISLLYTDSSGGGQGIGIGKDKEMIDGKFDTDLTLLADMVKDFNRPVFIRIAPEFNGAWSGYHIEYFAKSFQYIVDFLKNKGVTNAIYVWNYMPLNFQFDYSAWYPGDDYVDWWGVEFFDNHVTSASAKAEQKRFLDDARAHNKPVIIPESGPAKFNINNIAVWNEWFVPYFALINSDTNIKGFCYSNEDFTKTTTGTGWKDVQLPGTPIAPLYAQELLKPHYLHQQ